MLKKILRWLPVLLVLLGTYLMTNEGSFSFMWYMGLGLIVAGTLLLAKENLKSSAANKRG